MKLATIEDYKGALESGKLAVASCSLCGTRQAMPSETCFNCGSGELAVAAHSGAGRIFSWVVNFHAFDTGPDDHLPYMVLLVELDGGGRVYGRLNEACADSPEAEMPVELDVTATRERKYPVFNLKRAGSSGSHLPST